METARNVEAINNLLNVESYLGLLMDVAVQQSPGNDGADEASEGEPTSRFHERQTDRQID